MPCSPAASAAPSAATRSRTAAALAVFDLIEREDLLGEAQRVERALLARIGDWAETFPIVGEVRGKGAMFGVELVQPGTEGAEPRGADRRAEARDRRTA